MQPASAWGWFDAPCPRFPLPRTRFLPAGAPAGSQLSHLPHCTMLRKRMSQAGPIPCTTNTRWSICSGSPEEGRGAQGGGDSA